MNLELVEQLYLLQNDPRATPEQQSEATQRIAAIADEVAEEYLASLVLDSDSGVGRKRGDRRFESYDVLWARNVLEGPITGADGKTQTNPPITDKIGNILFHARYSRRSE